MDAIVRIQLEGLKRRLDERDDKEVETSTISPEDLMGLLTKIEDLENSQLDVPASLQALTPSHTLEDVKARVNQIIGILNQLSVN